MPSSTQHESNQRRKSQVRIKRRGVHFILSRAARALSISLQARTVA